MVGTKGIYTYTKTIKITHSCRYIYQSHGCCAYTLNDDLEDLLSLSLCDFPKFIPPSCMTRWTLENVRINGDRINGLFHLLINGGFIGVITHLLTYYLLTSWVIQACSWGIIPFERRKKNDHYFPLNPGCLIGIPMMGYFLNPITKGSITPYTA